MLSLRFVISAVGVLLVVLVAAVTLTITLTTSLDALRDVGKSKTSVLLGGVESKSLRLFDKEFAALEAMNELVRMSRLPWPSDDPSVIDTVFAPQLHVVFRSLGAATAPVSIAYFWDNTRVSYSPYNDTHYYLAVLLPSPVSAPGGLANQTIDGYRIFYPKDGVSADLPPPVRTEYNFVPGIEYRMRNTSTAVSIGTGTGNGFATNIFGFISRVVDDGTVAGRPLNIETYFLVATPLHRRGDPRGMSHLYGAFFVGLFVDDLSRFLRAARTTPNTAAFAVDRFGFLVGSSEDASFVTTAQVDPQATTPLGCTSTAAADSVSFSTAVYRVCRAHRSAYGHAALAALPDGTIREPDAMTELVTGGDGGAAFVSSKRLALAVGGFDIQLVLIIPEADVIGDVVQSRNVAIGIVSGLVVVAAVINFAIVALLLAPLGAIAERMHKAANLDDDAEDASVSAMAEVAELQEAYYAMNDELNRIRAFVPQSVLLEAKQRRADANKSEDSDGDGCGDEDENEDLDLLASVSGISRSGSFAHQQQQQLPRTSSTVNTSAAAAGTPMRTHSGSRMGRRESRFESATINAVNRRQSMAIGGRRQSMASVRSKVPSGAGAAKKQVGSYNLKAGMVTVLVANTAGFGPAVAAAPRDLAILHTTELVELINNAIVANGGVLASYHGDHFIATFNAAKPCASHATSAARTALVIRDGAPATGFSEPVRVAVATSRCVVGTLGCKDVKAFNTIGPAFQQACVLERMCPLHAAAPGESVALATRRTWQDVQTQLRGRVVDLVQLPASTAPTLLYKLMATVQHADDDDADSPKKDNAGAQKKKDDGNDNEWLYLVGTAEASDPFKPWNDAWEALAQGRVDAARERMACGGAECGSTVAASAEAAADTEAAPAAVEADGMIQAPGLKRHIDRFEALCAMPCEDRADRHSDLGEYYGHGWIQPHR